MKIVKAEVIPLSLRENEVPPRQRFFAPIKLTTDEGLVGWGEASDCFGHSYPMTLKAFFEEKVQWTILDQDPMPVEKLMAHVRRELYRRYVGFRDLATQAASAVEIALWDIRGKALGRPVSDLLGAYRDRIDIYASGKPAFHVPSEYHIEFNKPLLDRGTKAVKVRIGNNFDWDANFVREVRDLLGPDIQLFVDGKYNYTTDSAIRLSHILGEIGVGWFEEALPDYDLNELARLTAASPVPIAYGEHCFTIHDFRQLVEYEAADILQPDATVCGGISEALRVTHFGEAMGYRVVPHCAGLTAIGWAACVHFAACMPKFTLFEYDSSPEQPLRDRLPKEPLFAAETVVDGQIKVPTGPGLGVEIDEAFFKEFKYELDEDVARSSPPYATPHI